MVEGREQELPCKDVERVEEVLEIDQYRKHDWDWPSDQEPAGQKLENSLGPGVRDSFFSVFLGIGARAEIVKVDPDSVFFPSRGAQTCVFGTRCTWPR